MLKSEKKQLDSSPGTITHGKGHGGWIKEDELENNYPNPLSFAVCLCPPTPTMHLIFSVVKSYVSYTLRKIKDNSDQG